MTYLFLLLIGLQFHCYHLQDIQECRIGDDVMSMIINSNADFAFRLYKEMSSTQGDKNILFSPLGISVAFAILSLGASSETQRQIYRGLAFDLSQIEGNEIHEGFCDLIYKLNLPREGTQVKTGNALFFEKSLEVRRTFLKNVRNFYYTEDFFTDFQDSTRAKQQINDYLTTKTSGKTVNIVKDLSEQTSMVLVNYIFFKGDWKLRFHPKLTYEGDFLSYGNTYVKLSMMKKTSSYGYFHDEDLSCTVVRIPYTDNAEAWFILPDEGKLNDVVSSLEKEDLDNWRGSFEYRDIDLRIPKFSISASTDVTDLLQSLGVTNADLSEITGDHDLRFSQAFHEAVLDLHEDHTLLDQPGAGVFRGAQLLIEFNRPFLIVTLDTSTGTILLMGKILNPNEE